MKKRYQLLTISNYTIKVGFFYQIKVSEREEKKLILLKVSQLKSNPWFSITTNNLIMFCISNGADHCGLQVTEPRLQMTRLTVKDTRKDSWSTSRRTS